MKKKYRFYNYLMGLIMLQFGATGQSLLSEGFIGNPGTPVYKQNYWQSFSGKNPGNIKIIKKSLLSEYLGLKFLVGHSAILEPGDEIISKSLSKSIYGDGAEVYVSFLLKLDSLEENQNMLISLGTGSADTSLHVGRLFLKKDGAGFNVGIAKSTNNPTYLTARRLEYHTTYFILYRYKFNSKSNNDDEVALSVNESPLDKTFVPDLVVKSGEKDIGEAINTLYLRASGSKLFVDNLNVSDKYTDGIPGAYPYQKGTFYPTIYENNAALMVWYMSHDAERFELLKKLTPVNSFKENFTAAWSNENILEGEVSGEFEIRPEILCIEKGDCFVKKFQLSKEYLDLKSYFQIRLAPNLAPGKYEGEVKFSSKGKEPIYVLLGGTVPMPPSIKQIQQTAEGQVVEVFGRVITSSQFGNTVFVQDGTGGIAIVDDSLSKSVQIGDSIRVVGTIDKSNELIQVSGKMFFEKINVVSKPLLAKTIKLSEMPMHEGELVIINDIELEDKSFFFLNDRVYKINQMHSGNRVSATDSTYKGFMLVDSHTNLKGQAKPSGKTNITGIVSKNNGTFVLKPRFVEDIPGVTAYKTDIQGIGYDKTFDIATWKVYNLGFYEENERLAEFQKVIDSLQADVIVLQDVIIRSAYSKTPFLERFVQKHPEYKYLCSPDHDNGYSKDVTGGVCFLYRKEIVDSIKAGSLLKGTGNLPDYPGGSKFFWSEGRFPYLFTVNVTIGGVKKRVNLIGIQAANDFDGKEETVNMFYRRRQIDLTVLKDSLDKYYAKDNLLIAGDFNDDIIRTTSETSLTKESTYKIFVDDPGNYQILTKALDEKLYANYNLFLTDHIMVSNELENSYLLNSTNLEIHTNYTKNLLTYHYPVKARFQFIINPPSDMQAISSDYQSINITWKDNNKDVKKSELERSADNINFSKIADIPSGTFLFTDTGLEPNKKYYYRLRSVTSEGKSQFINADAITQILLASEVEYNSWFYIYPNPTDGIVEILSNEPSLRGDNIDAALTTIEGKVIWQNSGKLRELNDSINNKLLYHPAGIYLLYLQTKTKSGLLKVIRK
ncbi:Por secretion system C-terminal sorting domain-containing protein [Pseudarcicella hirudinis]|uniref:Por secretion system C-terminal sorting domain-containing protein n=1 Tax=Pseudarcicella hirudinis TaxID=1079859 RepID=A0A1I5RS90_9BACT|nr:Por secretion system C-terminal sorting domain-containing protein [Pseudarcicella hirudinis]